MADPEPTITTTSALKKSNELILSQNELNRFITSQKVANLDELGNKVKGLETDLVKESKKITDTANILDGGKGTFNIPNDLIPLLTYHGKQHTLEELFNSRQSFYSMF
ncbi:16131_t:CDS:1 [Funneliformis geosporum]|nr:16131_t:CDS:1 [Funneliformis geosporum]